MAGTANVYEYNPSNGTVTLHNFSASAGYSEGIIVYKEKLYVGTVSDGIWTFDGYQWEKVSSINYISSMAVHGDNLIVGIWGNITYLSSDGETFTVIDPAVAVAFDETISDILLGADGSFATRRDIREYSPASIATIAIADYKGGPFTSPPRSRSDEKRHRWIFSWDRSDGTNNIDDTILVGLGYVPRYLSLINYYPQWAS